MKSITLSILTFFISLHLFSQKIESTTSMRLNADEYYGQDIHGSIYYKSNDVIYKINENKTYQYTNLNNGSITSVDISNPLELVVLYQNTQQIVLLDNQLNEKKSFAFNDITPHTIVNATGYAPLNKLWLYEKSSNRVYLFDKQRIKNEKLTPILSSKIKHFQSKLNIAYWVDEKNDWYKSNIFGEIKLIGHLPKFKKIHIINHKIALLHINDNLYKYHVYSKKFDLIYENLKSDSNFSYSNQILTIFTGGELKINKIKLK